MVELPDQIRRQAEAARAHFQSTEPPQGGNSAEPGVIMDEPEVPLEQPTNAPEQVAVPPVEQAEDENSETFAQRYRSLQGMFNAETQRAAARDREAQLRIDRLEQLLAAMPTGPQPSATSQQPEEQPRFVSDKDRDEYGDSIDVMRRVSQEEVAPLIAQLSQLENRIGQLITGINTNIAPQVQQVVQRQAETAQDAFWRELSQQVPNWQQINNDKDFHQWLLDVDPLTGTTRQVYLEQAQQSQNPHRAASFFKMFSEISGKYTTNATAQPTRSAQTTELERQVAPGRSRSTSAPNSQAAPNYTRAQIQKFFDDVRTGKYKGREAERNRIERDIFAAQREGRIVANA